MSNRLPDYLRMQVCAAPRKEAVTLIGDVRITVITPRLIRIEQGAFTDEATLTVLSRDFCPCEAAVTRTENFLTIDTGALHIVMRLGVPLSEGLIITQLNHPAFTWHYGQKPLQNLKGTTSTLDTVDGECPLEDGLCSVDGFAVLDDSHMPIMTAEGWFAGREVCSDVYFFGYGHDYTGAVKDYYRLTGVPGMLPAFALGNWWSRYHAYTDTEYLGLMDSFHQHDVPLSVGIVDMDWHLVKVGDRHHGNGWTGYTWNEELFPDYRAFIRGLHDRGLKTALNLHPMSGVRYWDKQYEAMCRALGKDPSEQEPVPFNCLNPDFLKAYFEILHFPYEEDGVDFWWMDWQQGSDYAQIARQDYVKSDIEAITPLWMLNHMHYLASQRHGGRGMIFSRYSGYGSQRYPIGFSGDTVISWRSLKFQPYFTATASNVGYGWWSHDIGGHMGGFRDDELTARWVQLGVFSPIFRLHSSNSLFTGREPWKYNKRAECVMSDFMRLRHQLFPYLYTMNRRAHAELLPLVRPMYHVSPECSDAYQVPHEYWFGSEMVVSPVTDPADASDLAPADTWLPEGVWTDAMTGYVYQGGQRLTVYRPLEEMPVFLKAGAIVPLQAHVPGQRQLGQAADMEVLIAPGASNCFRLYEDDGESLAFEQGAYALTPLTLDWSASDAAFTIGTAQGDTSFVPERRWTLHFRGFRKGCTFLVDGRSADASYDAATNTFTLRLPAMTAAQSVTVTVSHEAALTHDNSDCREKFIQRLIRAQIFQDDKARLLKYLDDEVARNASGEARGVKRIRLGADMYEALGGYMFELLRQLTF